MLSSSSDFVTQFHCSFVTLFVCLFTFILSKLAALRCIISANSRLHIMKWCKSILLKCKVKVWHVKMHFEVYGCRGKTSLAVFKDTSKWTWYGKPSKKKPPDFGTLSKSERGGGLKNHKLFFQHLVWTFFNRGGGFCHHVQTVKS